MEALAVRHTVSIHLQVTGSSNIPTGMGHSWLKWQAMFHIYDWRLKTYRSHPNCPSVEGTEIERWIMFDVF